MEIRVFLRSIGELQSDFKKDSTTEKWYARDLELEANQNCMYRDAFLVRYSGEKAVDPELAVGKEYLADVAFSVRESKDGHKYQCLWLRGLALVDTESNKNNDVEPF